MYVRLILNVAMLMARSVVSGQRKQLSAWRLVDDPARGNQRVREILALIDLEAMNLAVFGSAFGLEVALFVARLSFWLLRPTGSRVLDTLGKLAKVRYFLISVEVAHGQQAQISSGC